MGRIEQKIDFTAALAGKCLLLSSEDDCPCPRLIWIEEDEPSTTQPQPVQRFAHFRRMRWLKRGKHSATKFRVRFLCAHDCTLVACGADENGYVLEQNDWQRWLQKCLPVLQVRTPQLRMDLSRRSGLKRCYMYMWSFLLLILVKPWRLELLWNNFVLIYCLCCKVFKWWSWLRSAPSPC